jgi:hypothetical protein
MRFPFILHVLLYYIAPSLLLILFVLLIHYMNTLDL